MLEEKLNEYFDRLEEKEPSVQQGMHVYKVFPDFRNSDSTFLGFSPEDSYWMDKVQRAPYRYCRSRGILYRPKIVKEMMTMVENAFNENEPNGIMMTGLHGVGKSHSLVNLVRTLQYDGSCKYLVTFIPDCGQWEFVHDLYNAICSSFGNSLSALKWPVSSDLSENSLNLNTFVTTIDLIL